MRAPTGLWRGRPGRFAKFVARAPEGPGWSDYSFGPTEQAKCDKLSPTRWGVFHPNRGVMNDSKIVTATGTKSYASSGSGSPRWSISLALSGVQLELRGLRNRSSGVSALQSADDEHSPRHGGATWHLSGNTSWGWFRTNSVQCCPAAIGASRQRRVSESETSWLSAGKPEAGAVRLRFGAGAFCAGGAA